PTPTPSRRPTARNHPPPPTTNKNNKNPSKRRNQPLGRSASAPSCHHRHHRWTLTKTPNWRPTTPTWPSSTKPTSSTTAAEPATAPQGAAARGGPCPDPSEA